MTKPYRIFPAKGESITAIKVTASNVYNLSTEKLKKKTEKIV